MENDMNYVILRRSARPTKNLFQSEEILRFAQNDGIEKFVMDSKS